MMINQIYTYHENLSHLSDLVALAKNRYYPSVVENFFIEKVAQQLGISKEDYHLIKTGRYTKPYVRPNTAYKILPLFHRLILLLYVDGFVTPSRLEFCRNFALRNGLNLYAVEEILQQVLREPKKVMPVKVFHDTFKKYMN